MRTFKIEITETELDFIRLALSVLQQTALKDADGEIKRKMPKYEDRTNYHNAIKEVYKKFLVIGLD
jgi:hypothetical protein